MSAKIDWTVTSEEPSLLLTNEDIAYYNRFFPSSETLFLVIIIALILLSLFGNSYVCFYIMRDHLLRREHALFFNLALVNLLVMCTTFLYWIYTFVKGSSWTTGDCSCKLFKFVQVLVEACSVYTIVALVFQQFVKFFNLQVVNCRSWLMPVSPWILSLIPSLPYFYLAGVIKYSSRYNSCNIFSTSAGITYTIVRTFEIIILPLMMCIAMYVAIFWKKGFWKNNPSSPYKSVTFNLTLEIAVCLIVTSLPFAAETIRLVSCDSSKVSDVAFDFTVIYLIRSVIVPYLYLVSAQNNQFKNEAMAFNEVPIISKS